MLTPRAILCVISITYDREIAGQDLQAKACYDELVTRCNRGGYYPYRLGIQSMYDRPEDSESYRDLINNLKQALDPKGVLAPGRYDASERLETSHQLNGD
jgi:4-cresol dehydrogenase (hydroxylating) flavoprotein subunit